MGTTVTIDRKKEKRGGSPWDGPEGREKVGDGGGMRQRSDELAFWLHSGNIRVKPSLVHFSMNDGILQSHCIP